jgi:hypothetical protein
MRRPSRPRRRADAVWMATQARPVLLHRRYRRRAPQPRRRARGWRPRVAVGGATSAPPVKLALAPRGRVARGLVRHRPRRALASWCWSPSRRCVPRRWRTCAVRASAGRAGLVATAPASLPSLRALPSPLVGPRVRAQVRGELTPRRCLRSLSPVFSRSPCASSTAALRANRVARHALAAPTRSRFPWPARHTFVRLLMGGWVVHRVWRRWGRSRWKG